MWVSRYALMIALCALPAGGLAICYPTAAAAQETSKPEEPRTQGGGTDSKLAPTRVPRDIVVVNPCRTAHPPSYCNVKN
jgi:hypothetical protein